MKRCEACQRLKDPRSFSKVLALVYISKQRTATICNACLKKHPIGS